MTAFRDPIAWEETLPIRQSSPAWRALLRGYYGSELTPAELGLWRELTGREAPPAGGLVELLVVAGRRGGKSETIARLATFEGIHGGHEVALAPGQLGLIAVISPLREQSQEILGYVRGLAALPQVKRYVLGEPTRDGVTFRNAISIKVMTADAVALSGPTLVCAIRDEWAKWPGDDAAVPDREIENSFRPALAPVDGAPPRRILGITSAYVQDGLAYETDRDMFGVADAPVLVARGTTERFNPNVDRAWLARERKRIGEAVYAREYGGIWQPSIVEGYFPAAVVERAVDSARASAAEGVPQRSYHAGIDAAFQGDLFALAIASRVRIGDEPARTVLDGVWVWRARDGVPLGVESTVHEVVKILRAFGCDTCSADQFAYVPLSEAFARHGVYLRSVPWAASSKPGKFARVRAGMTDGHVRIPDEPALVREFCNIRARMLRSGGEQIEARSGTDDRVHAAVLALSDAMDAEPDNEERIATVPGPAPGSPEAYAAFVEQRERERIRKFTEQFEAEKSGANPNDWVWGPG